VPGCRLSAAAPHLICQAQLLQVAQPLELWGVYDGHTRPVQLEVACSSSRGTCACAVLSRDRHPHAQAHAEASWGASSLTMDAVIEHLLPPVPRVLVPVLLAGCLEDWHWFQVCTPIQPLKLHAGGRPGQPEAPGWCYAGRKKSGAGLQRGEQAGSCKAAMIRTGTKQRISGCHAANSNVYQTTKTTPS
jgi:hypothetical protein